MRAWRALGFFAASVLFYVTQIASAPPPLALVNGDPAPDMRGQTADGAYFMIQYKPGTTTLVNFWATWCAPCRDEMAKLDELFRRRAGDGLQVVGVHAGFVEKSDLGEYLKAVPVGYPVVVPDVRYLDAWGGVAVLPMSFLVDGQGKILRRYIGAAPEQVAGLVTDAEAALDGRPLGPVIIPDRPVVATDPASKAR